MVYLLKKPEKVYLCMLCNSKIKPSMAFKHRLAICYQDRIKYKKLQWRISDSYLRGRSELSKTVFGLSDGLIYKRIFFA